ncbi:uncharacterized protein [Anas platyrhynchos]|uniref:uncharacterized protein n=1 Tax=Anas platyrhynchos TaxID=8839 RepID=UPI003AF24F2F
MREEVQAEAVQGGRVVIYSSWGNRGCHPQPVPRRGPAACSGGGPVLPACVVPASRLLLPHPVQPGCVPDFGVLRGAWQSAPDLPRVPGEASLQSAPRGGAARPAPGRDAAGAVVGGAPPPLPPLLLLLLPPPQPLIPLEPSAGSSGQAHHCYNGPAAHRAGVSALCPEVDALQAKGVPAGVHASCAGQRAQADGALIVPGGLLGLLLPPAHGSCSFRKVQMVVLWGRLPWCRVLSSCLGSSPPRCLSGLRQELGASRATRRTTAERSRKNMLYQQADIRFLGSTTLSRVL